MNRLLFASKPFAFVLAAAAPLAASAMGAHVWEKQELTFTAARAFANPYTEAVVWVDLTGPSFKKRVYGFWDGGQTFRVRVAGDRAGHVDVAERFEPGRRRPRRQERLVRRRSPGPRRRSRRIRCAADSCGRPPTTTRSSTPTARRSSPSATPGGPPAPTASAGTTTTRSGRSGPRPASRTTSATARRKATTGSTSSPRFPTG